MGWLPVPTVFRCDDVQHVAQQARDGDLPKLYVPISIGQNDFWNISGTLKELFDPRQQSPRGFVRLEVWQQRFIGLGVCKVVTKELANAGAPLFQEGYFASLMARPVLDEYGTPFFQQRGDVSIVQQSTMSFDERAEGDSRRPMVID